MRFARTQGVLWMNFTKTFVALLSAAVVLSLFSMWTQKPSTFVWPFFMSGFIGLALGDVFLISAFARIGSARTMVLWGFQPVFVAIGSYLWFGETINGTRMIAILFLISCLMSFSFEGFRRQGHWELKGLGFAMMGVLLDAVGLFFSRYGFESNLIISPLEGHFYRCCGAMTCFLILKQAFPFSFTGKISALSKRDRTSVLTASFLGTFLAIYLGLIAIQIGHLPSLAALSITTPLFTALIEHVIERKWPSPIFLFAFLQFVVGFLLLVGYE